MQTLQMIWLGKTHLKEGRSKCTHTKIKKTQQHIYSASRLCTNSGEFDRGVLEQWRKPKLSRSCWSVAVQTKSLTLQKDTNAWFRKPEKASKDKWICFDTGAHFFVELGQEYQKKKLNQSRDDEVRLWMAGIFKILLTTTWIPEDQRQFIGV